MFQIQTNQHSYQIIQRLAQGITLVLLGTVLLLAWVALGRAMGGNIGGYIVALALVGALTVLALHTLASSSALVASAPAPQQRQVEVDSTNIREQQVA